MIKQNSQGNYRVVSLSKRVPTISRRISPNWHPSPCNQITHPLAPPSQLNNSLQSGVSF